MKTEQLQQDFDGCPQQQCHLLAEFDTCCMRDMYVHTLVLKSSCTLRFQQLLLYISNAIISKEV